MKNTSSSKSSKKPASRMASAAAVGTTSSGPSHPVASKSDLAVHAQEQDFLAAAMPANKLKPLEYGHDNAVQPSQAASIKNPSSSSGAGTLSEKITSSKTGAPALEPVHIGGSLDRVRVELRRPDADDQSRRAGRRQSEFAEGRAARPRLAGGLHPSREDHSLRS